MTSAEITQRIWLGLGEAGAMVQILGPELNGSDFITGTEGIQFAWGRSDDFRDPQAASLQFILENADGRFTPNNPNVPYATPLARGTKGVYQDGTRLFAFTVRNPTMLDGEENWGRLQIVCDDDLGTLARAYITTSLLDSLDDQAGLLMRWRLDDEQNAPYLVEDTGNAGGMTGLSAGVTAGVTAWPGLPGTAVSVLSSASNTTGQNGFATIGAQPDYAPGDYGWWTFWIEDTTGSGIGGIGWTFGDIDVMVYLADSTLNVTVGGSLVTLTAATATGPLNLVQVHFYVNASDGYVHVQVWINGAQFIDQTLSSLVDSSGVQPQTSLPPLSQVWFASPPIPSGTTAQAVILARLTHTLDRTQQELSQMRSAAPTLDVWLAALAMIAGVTLTQPEPMTPGPIGYESIEGRAALDAFNDGIRTEQAQVWAEASGTAPDVSSAVHVLPRTVARSSAVKASFDVQQELQGPPQFGKTSPNMAAVTQVVGPNNTVTVSRTDLLAQVGGQSDSQQVLFVNDADLTAWGGDRLMRGALAALELSGPIVIDNRTLATDRSADLVGLTPGDRVRLTNLPAGIFGYTTWDGWLFGKTELHTPQSDQFSLSLVPCLPPYALFDSARFGAAGALSLASAITAAATSLTFATTGPGFTTQTPVTIQVDEEQMTVTATSGTTLTVTRGVNGTTAVAHAAGALLDLADPATFMF